MLIHDPPADGETQARPLFASAETRIEDPGEILLRYTFPGVGKVDNRYIAVLTGGYG